MKDRLINVLKCFFIAMGVLFFAMIFPSFAHEIIFTLRPLI